MPVTAISRATDTHRSGPRGGHSPAFRRTLAKSLEDKRYPTCDNSWRIGPTAASAPLAFADKSTPATPVTETPRLRAIPLPARSSISKRASSCSANAIASASPLSRSRESSRTRCRDATDRTEIHFEARALASAAAPGRSDPIASSRCTAGGMTTCLNKRRSNSSRPVRARAMRGPVSATMGVTRRQRPRRPVPRADSRPPQCRLHPVGR